MTRDTIVFIHALGLDRHAFDPVKQALSDSLHLISHDLLGHGKSRGHQLSSFAKLAEDVMSRAKEERCNHNETVHLVGHAFGAIIAAHACQNHTEIATLTMIAAPIAAQPSFRTRAEMARQDPSAMSLESLERWFGGLDDFANISWARRYGEECLRSVDGDNYAQGWDLLATQPEFTNLAERLPPTLILWAEDDRSTPASLVNTIENAFAAHGRSKEVRHVLLPRGGHMLPLVHPVAVASALQSFWSDKLYLRSI